MKGSTKRALLSAAIGRALRSSKIGGNIAWRGLLFRASVSAARSAQLTQPRAVGPSAWRALFQS
jgi:hypothetical protein